MKALYFQENRPPLELFVVKKNEDGTVDLARTAEGEAVITSCPLSKEDVPGTAALFIEAEESSGGDETGNSGAGGPKSKKK